MNPPLTMRPLPAAMLVGILSAAASAQDAPRRACEPIQFRLVDEGAPASAHRYHKASGESFALQDSVLLDAHGIDHIELEPSGLARDSWTVLAYLTAAGGQRMLAVSRSHMDEHIAVLMGDDVIEVPAIAGPIRVAMPLRVGASRQEADSLVTRANRARTGCSAA